MFDKLWDHFNKNFNSLEDKEFYLLSTKWFKQWKLYVNYPTGKE